MRRIERVNDAPDAGQMANVSVDLDGLHFYHQIHGLKAGADELAIYRVAMPRLLDLFDEVGIKATFFAVGSDLEHNDAIESLRDAASRGHEIASHSYSHAYDLREWSKLSIAEDVDRAYEALVHAVGDGPRGFRTPGYNVDTRILRILAERGYLYDSSVLPSPAYHGAKGLVMGAMAAVGRPSGSSMVDLNSVRAPTQPYRPSRWEFWKEGDRKHSLPIWEIPIGVNRLLRAPVIGTTIGALHSRLIPSFFRSFATGKQTLQIELHAIDLMDREDAAVSDELAGCQPDTRRTWTSKRESLAQFIALAAADYEIIRLDDMAERLSSAAGPTVVA